MGTITNTGNVRITTDHAFSETQAIGGPATSNAAITVSQALANGTGDSQIDQAFSSAGTLTDSASVTFILQGVGVEVDPGGTGVSFATNKLLVVKNTSLNGSGISVNGDGFEPWTLAAEDGLTIPPGGFVALGSLLTGVTIADLDEVVLTNLGAVTQTYEFMVVGIAE